MDDATVIELLGAIKTHPAFNLIREDLVGNSNDLNYAIDYAIECLKQEGMYLDD